MLCNVQVMFRSVLIKQRMLPSYRYGTLVFAFLGIFFFVQGNSDVIVRLKDDNVDFINVSFSSNFFQAFFNCVCSRLRTCSGIFNDNHKIGIVDKEGMYNSHREYYQCERGGVSNSTIQCSGENKPIDGPVQQKLNCTSSTATLVWNNLNEGIAFNNYYTCKQYCISGCYCPMTPPTTISDTTTEITSATTTKITTQTTTKTTTELPPTTYSTTKTTSSTSKVSSTSVGLSTAAKTSDDNIDSDPPLGLIIGVVIAVIFIAVIIAVIAFFIWRRKQTHNTSKPQRKVNGPPGTHGDSNVRSDPQYALTDMNSGKSKNDRLTPSECATKPQTRNAAPGYEFAQAMGENYAHVGDNSTSIPFSKQFIDGSSSDNGYCAISDTTDTKENNKVQSNSKLAKKETGIKSTSRDADYGYSSVQDEDIQAGSYQTASVPPYAFAGKPESRNTDSGYEYAGPENTYDTPQANKAAQQHKDNSHKTVPGTSGAYSVAGNVNNSAVASSDKSKDIYSRLHEDNRQIQNPYNTLLQSNKDNQDSLTATCSSADQSKDIYSRLHEDNRQLQNPYNTLSQTTEDATTPASLAGSAHSSQTANQPSRYSFAQSMSNGVSSKNINDNTTDDNKAATSQNATYHVLEPSTSTEEDPQEGKDNRDNVSKEKKHLL